VPIDEQMGSCFPTTALAPRSAGLLLSCQVRPMGAGRWPISTQRPAWAPTHG